MQPKVHPRLTFLLEICLLRFRIEERRARAFDRQIQIPLFVMHPIDHAHPAALVFFLHLVEIEDDIPNIPRFCDLLLRRMNCLRILPYRRCNRIHGR